MPEEDDLVEGAIPADELDEEDALDEDDMEDEDDDFVPPELVDES